MRQNFWQATECAVGLPSNWWHTFAWGLADVWDGLSRQRSCLSWPSIARGFSRYSRSAQRLVNCERPRWESKMPVRPAQATAPTWNLFEKNTQKCAQTEIVDAHKLQKQSLCSCPSHVQFVDLENEVEKDRIDKEDCNGKYAHERRARVRAHWELLLGIFEGLYTLTKVLYDVKIVLGLSIFDRHWVFSCTPQSNSKIWTIAKTVFFNIFALRLFLHCKFVSFTQEMEFDFWDLWEIWDTLESRLWDFCASQIERPTTQTCCLTSRCDQTS